jgi:hypothetical protein
MYSFLLEDLNLQESGRLCVHYNQILHFKFDLQRRRVQILFFIATNLDRTNTSSVTLVEKDDNRIDLFIYSRFIYRCCQ